MAWDITTARLKIGLTAGDVSKDTELQAAMNTALALAEAYCDRYFLYQLETQYFVHVVRNVFLKRYPVDRIQSITKDGAVTPNTLGEINKESGIVGASNMKHVTLEYMGGYQVLPLDLELALWGVFDNTYATMTSAGGGVSGEIKKLAITGVGSIDYDSSNASSDTSSAFGGLLPAMSKSILDLYHRRLT